MWELIVGILPIRRLAEQEILISHTICESIWIPVMERLIIHRARRRSQSHTVHGYLQIFHLIFC